MKEDFLARLKKYLLSAGAIVASGASANAQIMHTDVDPDSNVTGAGNNYLLDLNNDGTMDFDIYVFSSIDTLINGTYWNNHAVVINPLGQNAVAVDFSSTLYPYAFQGGAPLGPALGSGLIWDTSPDRLMAFHVTMGTGTSAFTFAGGNWSSVQDHYLGLKLVVNGLSYYGWARLDVIGPTQFTIKEYAVQVNSNTSLNTGDTFALPPVIQCNPAALLQATDVSDHQNASDMSVSFVAPWDETGIGEYRVIVVKDGEASSFSMADAQAVGSTSYISVVPDTFNHSFILDSAQTDKNGDPIVEYQPYRFFVLSVADGIDATLDSLSQPSNSLTLKHYVPTPTDTVMSVILADIADYGNGMDIQVTFDPVADESKVGSYHVYIVKSSSAGTFDLDYVNWLGLGLAYSVIPNGVTYNCAFGPGSLDSDEDQIQSGVPYKAFVFAVADGVETNINTLSPPSNEVTLNAPADTLDTTDVTTVQIVKERLFHVRHGDGYLSVISGSSDPISLVRLYAINGAMVREERFQTSSVAELATGRLDPGIYVLEVYGHAKAERHRIFITGR